MPVAPSPVVDALTGLLGESRVSTDADTLLNHGRDWTRAIDPRPLAVVFPASTEEVQSVVQLANRLGVALVPSGGRTGLSAGAVAAAGEVVLSLDKMNRILDFDPVDRSVHCEAGVVTESLQQFAEDQGCFYPVDFASSGSSQIGGNIATNAGGIKVLRYGMTREQVLGLTVVTGAGEVLELNRGLKKNNTGYDFRHLFIGSEGTLGVITEARLQLASPPPELAVMVVGVPDFAALMALFAEAGERLALTAFEFFSELALQKVVEHQGLQRPFAGDAPFYALIEFESGSEQQAEQALSLFEHALEQGWVSDGVISQSLEQAASLWRLREDISETISRWTPYKNDIAARIADVPALLAAIDALVSRAYPDFEIVWFGHIGDGNVHLNILKPDDMPREGFLAACGSVNDEVCAAVQRFGGTISAEHGIGMLKKPYLAYSRSEAEITLMRGLKHLFDPNGIMNPGKLIDH